MKGICDHPNWWVVLSYDGYGSYLQNNALEVFAADKILIMKEEGETSQVSQAYDQMVAKSNKKFTRLLLDGYRFHTKGMINQSELILIINAAINSSDANSWQTLFIKQLGQRSMRQLLQLQIDSLQTDPIFLMQRLPSGNICQRMIDAKFVHCLTNSRVTTNHY